MSPAQTVVFGDDHSDGADEAWGWVCAQTWAGWRAEVLTAVMPPVGPPPDPADAAPHAWEPPTPRDPGDAGFTETVHLRADADPRYVLEHQDHAGVLVVGPVGKGFLKSLHLGSIAEHVLANATVPVLVARGASPVRRVLVAIDGSDHAQRAVVALASMPWYSDLDSVTLVTILDGKDRDADVFDRAVSALPGVAVETVALERGERVWESICGAASRDGSDLVVAGTHSFRKMRERVLGSTATALASHAPCAVLFGRDSSDGS
ncbi:MAG: universal stress protein [Acidimicrobiia bacterium]